MVGSPTQVQLRNYHELDVLQLLGLPGRRAVLENTVWLRKRLRLESVDRGHILARIALGNLFAYFPPRTQRNHSSLGPLADDHAHYLAAQLRGLLIPG